MKLKKIRLTLKVCPSGKMDKRNAGVAGIGKLDPEMYRSISLDRYVVKSVSVSKHQYKLF